MAKRFWLKLSEDKKNVALEGSRMAEKKATRGRPSKNCIFRVKF